MKKVIKIFTGVMFVAVVSVMGMVGYASYKIPNNFNVTDIENVRTNINLPISHTDTTKAKVRSVDTNLNGEENHTVVFKLFGIIPIERVKVTISPTKKVAVLGLPFGIKLYTDGVLIVNITEFDTNGGTACPAKDGGLKAGDYIIAVEGKKVYSNKEIESIISKKPGSSIKIEYYRNNKRYTTYIQPEISSTDNNYHLGMWLKDSSAGIGTLTFYDAETGIVAGLGHALCDNDTGKMISVNRGSIVKAEILSVTKSKNGFAGELCGRFANGEYSKALLNSETGIYALCDNTFQNAPIVEVCNKQYVEKGSAKILVTTNGQRPSYYNCKIKSINYSSGDTRNMVVEITDQELLLKTGGIVQGMSGSPIIQNGKLVGALTHVFVDDPTKGYAIFAENMLETAQSVAESNKLKEAS